ncbi:MAG: hypothetical protein H6766_03965 [Candidatus Peribacteria bacterium]|nr:MAG: hypothetical protein H6766_03965 [Candidatus Peribacteria bacterium]
MIDALTDQLAATFVPNRETVTDYTDSVSISLGQQDFLMTDITLTRINQLDRHLGQLYAIATEEKLLSNHHQIWSTIQEKIDLIIQSLLHNNYFHMTYGWRMAEVIEKLENVSYNREIAA